MSHTGPAVTQPDPTKRQLALADLPLLPPTEDSYIVQVRTGGACRGELGWELHDPHLFTHRPQRVPGPDGAGVVISAPAGAPFKQGDEIMFALDAWESGTMRKFTSVPVTSAARRPKLPWTEAAAIPLSAETAWQGLFEHGGLKASFDGQANKGTKVLVTGASGSVGLWILRLGSASGAHMVGVGSGARAGEMKANGAAEIIDYKTTSVPEWAKGGQVDLIIDCSGKDQADMWSALKDGGLFLSVA